jgi:hypothetical protein
MAATYISADWLDEDSLSQDELDKQAELNARLAELHRVSNYPPLNYEIGGDEKLSKIRPAFVQALMDAQKAINRSKTFSDNFLDKFMKDLQTEITEAEMYASRYKSPEEATKAYIKDNKRPNLVIDNFMV